METTVTLLTLWVFFFLILLLQKKVKAPLWSDTLGEFPHYSTSYVQCVNIVEISLLGNACEVSSQCKFC